ncbi:MAG: hypothetical protein NVS2B5_23990 [Beijerinckiaceae bacterium]
MAPERPSEPAAVDISVASAPPPASPLLEATEASIGGVQGAAEGESVTPQPRRAPAPPPEHVLANQKVITQADPNRPKRGGWWQRAKATLTGE